MIRELTPFLSSFFTLLIVLRHHSAKLDSCWRGIDPERFSGANRLNQTCLATTHEVRRCCIVSSSWSQRGHLSGWGSPLLANLSAVQHLLRIANHRKILHLFGAQDFHSYLQGSKVTEPKKNMLCRLIWRNNCHLHLWTEIMVLNGCSAVATELRRWIQELHVSQNFLKPWA
jgi:hypothetical protein